MADLEDDAAPGGLSETPDERAALGVPRGVPGSPRATPEEADAAIVQAALALEGVRGVSLRFGPTRGPGSWECPLSRPAAGKACPTPARAWHREVRPSRALDKRLGLPLLLGARRPRPSRGPAREFAPLVVRGKALAGLCASSTTEPPSPPTPGGSSRTWASSAGSAPRPRPGQRGARGQRSGYRALLRQCPEGIYLFLDPADRGDEREDGGDARLRRRRADRQEARRGGRS